MISFTDQHIRPGLESPVPSILEEAYILLARLHFGIGDEYLSGGGDDAAGLLAELEVHFDLFDVLEFFGDAQRVEDVHQVVEH